MNEFQGFYIPEINLLVFPYLIALRSCLLLLCKNPVIRTLDQPGDWDRLLRLGSGWVSNICPPNPSSFVPQHPLPPRTMPSPPCPTRGGDKKAPTPKCKHPIFHRARGKNHNRGTQHNTSTLQWCKMAHKSKGSTSGAANKRKKRQFRTQKGTRGLVSNRGVGLLRKIYFSKSHKKMVFGVSSVISVKRIWGVGLALDFICQLSGPSSKPPL